MGQKVLVFESDANFAADLRNELTKLGCNVQVVDDGNTGLQVATSDRPDLILLSIELPRMNGFSVCNKLKKDPQLKDVPLVIMSSESSEETFEQHRKLRTRAEEYIHKPIAFGELLEHIRNYVPIDGDDAEADPIMIDEAEVLEADIDEDSGDPTIITAAVGANGTPASVAPPPPPAAAPSVPPAPLAVPRVPSAVPPPPPAASS